MIYTTEEWLFFADSDIVIKTPDWLQKFTEYVSLNNDVEVFIPRLFNIYENSYSSYRSIKIVGTKAFHDIEIINDLTNTFPCRARSYKSSPTRWPNCLLMLKRNEPYRGMNKC